jgi:hypothetical protein
MNRCPQCQAENPEAARFCSHCGKAIGTPPPGLPPSAPGESARPPGAVSPAGGETKAEDEKGRDGASPAEKGPAVALVKGQTPDGSSAPVGEIQSAPSGTPIRLVLQKVETPPPAAEEPEEESGGIPPQTGLVLGVVIIIGMIFATLPTVVFTFLICVLALLHRELAREPKPLEDYARLIPHGFEQLFHRIGRPDGRLILSLMFLAVAIYLAHPIVFGLAGAAALLTALFLLDFLDRPATSALNWLSKHEDAWGERLKAALKPERCHVLAALSLFPFVYYLAMVFLPERWAPVVPFGPRFGGRSWWMAITDVLDTLPAFAYRLGFAAGVVAVLLILMWRQLRQPAKAGGEPGRGLARHTLHISTLTILMGVGCAAIQMAREMKIPFLAEAPEWNGLCLGALPVLGLGLWFRGYLARQKDPATRPGPSPETKAVNPKSDTVPAAGQGSPPAANRAEEPVHESVTWHCSGLAAAMTAATGFLLWRALDLEKRGLGQGGGAALFAVMLVGWFVLARFLLSLVRPRPHAPTPEWAAVFLAVTASAMLCFFSTHFAAAASADGSGGSWGLAGAIVPVILMWKELARLRREFREPPPAPPAPEPFAPAAPEPPAKGS